MSEMVERVARAMADGQDLTWLYDERTCALCDPKRLAIQRQKLVANARAAIEAMREPTQEMVVEAMIQPHPSVADAGGIIAQSLDAIRIDYRAMIDEALK